MLAPRQDMFLEPCFVVRLPPLHQDVEFVGDLKGAVDGFGGSHAQGPHHDLGVQSQILRMHALEQRNRW